MPDSRDWTIWFATRVDGSFGDGPGSDDASRAPDDGAGGSSGLGRASLCTAACAEAHHEVQARTESLFSNIGILVDQEKCTYETHLIVRMAYRRPSSQLEKRGLVGKPRRDGRSW
jgi:hypothetical protein